MRILFIAILIFYGSLWCLKKCHASTNAMPASFTLAFMGPTNSTDLSAIGGGNDALVAFQMGIHNINKNSQLLPNTNLKLIVCNSESDVGLGSFRAFQQVILQNAIGVVGDLNSIVSEVNMMFWTRYIELNELSFLIIEAIQNVLRHYQVPQISFGSASTEFTVYHDSKYPYFLRTISTQRNHSFAVGYFLLNQGWKNIALVDTTDPHMFYDTLEFLGMADALGIQVIERLSFSIEVKNLSQEMKKLKNSQAKIFIYLGTIQNLPIVIKHSLMEGLYGYGYQWIIPQMTVFRAVLINQLDVETNNFSHWAQGLLSVEVQSHEDSHIYDEYEKQWANVIVGRNVSSVHSNVIMPLANFAYDAVFMLAHALHHMIEDLHVNPSDRENRELFLKVLKKVNFTGVTGRVFVDHNGDRTLDFVINNFQENQIVEVGKVYQNGTISYAENKKVYYMGGILLKPSDLPTRSLITISLWIVEIFISLCLLIIVLCWALIITVLLRRNHPIIKKSGFFFLIMILVGIVFLAIAMILRTLESHFATKALCIADVTIINAGYSLVIASLLVNSVTYSICCRY